MAFVDEETNVGGGNTATVLVPAAAAAGDRLLIQLTMTSDVSTSATAGLTQIGLSSPSTAGTGFMEHWTGVVTSGGVLDPGDTISIPLTSNAPWSIICAAYDPADVLGFFSNYAANANDSTVTTPSGTTLGPCIATHWYGVISNLPGITTPITWTDHASTTKRAEVCNLLATGGNFREGLGMMADEVIASAGAVAGRLATPSELVRGQGVLILLGTTVDQPVANAGTDDSMAAGATEALNGTMSDGGGAGGPYTPLTWRIISDTSGGASLSSTSVEDPDLTAGPNGGTIVLGFKGEDSAGIESDEDTVTITVVGAEDTAVPNADGTVTGWIPSTGTDIYPLLADNNDATYATSPDTPTAHPLRHPLSLINPSGPGDGLAFSCRVSRVNASSASVVVKLIEGASTIIATSAPVSIAAGSVQQVNLVLTPAEIASITDEDDLDGYAEVTAVP